MPTLPAAGPLAPAASERLRAEDAAAAIQRADTADSDWFRAQRQPGGFFATTGWAAWSGLDAFRRAVAARIDASAASLDSPDQARRYRRLAQGRAALMLAEAERHAWAERAGALQRDGLDRERAALADAAAWGDDEAAAEAFERSGRAGLIGRAALSGWDRATLASALRGYDGAFTLARIGRLAARDPAAAAALLDQRGRQLPPADAASAAKLVAAARSRQRVEQMVARLEGEPPPEAPDGGETEAAPPGFEPAARWEARRAAARQDPSLSPAERAVVLLRLDHDQAAQRDQAGQEARAAREQAARQVLEGGHDPFGLPPLLRAALDPGQFAALAAAYADNGRVPFAALIEERLLDLARDDPARLIGTDLSLLWGRHDSGRVAYWRDQQQSLAREPARALLRRVSYAQGDRALARDGQPAPVRARVTMRAWIDAWHDAHHAAPAVTEIASFATTLLTMEHDAATPKPARDTETMEAADSHAPMTAQAGETTATQTTKLGEEIEGGGANGRTPPRPNLAAGKKPGPAGWSVQRGRSAPSEEISTAARNEPGQICQSQ